VGVAVLAGQLERLLAGLLGGGPAAHMGAGDGHPGALDDEGERLAVRHRGPAALDAARRAAVRSLGLARTAGRALAVVARRRLLVLLAVVPAVAAASAHGENGGDGRG